MVGVHHLPLEVLSNVIEQLDLPAFLSLLGSNNRLSRFLGFDVEALCLDNVVRRLPGETWGDAFAHITHRAGGFDPTRCTINTCPGVDGVLVFSEQSRGVLLWHLNMNKPATLFDARVNQLWVVGAFFTGDGKRVVITTFSERPDDVEWGGVESEAKAHIFDAASLELIDSHVLGDASSIVEVGGRLFFNRQKRVLFNPRNGQTVQVPDTMRLNFDSSALYCFVDDASEMVLLVADDLTGFVTFNFATAVWKEVCLDVSNPNSPFYFDGMILGGSLEFKSVNQAKNHVLVTRHDKFGVFFVDLDTGFATAVPIRDNLDVGCLRLDRVPLQATTLLWLNSTGTRLEYHQQGDSEQNEESPTEGAEDQQDPQPVDQLDEAQENAEQPRIDNAVEQQDDLQRWGLPEDEIQEPQLAEEQALEELVEEAFQEPEPVDEQVQEQQGEATKRAYVVSGTSGNFMGRHDWRSFVHRGISGHPFVIPAEREQSSTNAARSLFNDLIRSGALSPGRFCKIALQ